MPIELNTPITVPAVEERQADKLWILTMNIIAKDSTAPVKAYFSVAPYISATNEVLTEQIQHIAVEDVLTACASNPTLATALGAIYDAVAVLCEENNLFGMEVNNE